MLLTRTLGVSSPDLSASELSEELSEEKLDAPLSPFDDVLLISLAGMAVFTKRRKPFT